MNFAYLGAFHRPLPQRQILSNSDYRATTVAIFRLNFLDCDTFMVNRSGHLVWDALYRIQILTP